MAGHWPPSFIGVFMDLDSVMVNNHPRKEFDVLISIHLCLTLGQLPI